MAMHATPIHLMCRLQWWRLRAWKKRSLRARINVGGRIRPHAYSSSSSAFRGILDDWSEFCEQPVILWIVTSYRLPGRSSRVPSLAAKIHVDAVHRGDEKGLDRQWRRYVWNWQTSKEEARPKLCRVVEADAAKSRFFPANDMVKCLSRLRFVKKDDKRRAYSPRTVLRVRSAQVHHLEEYAETIAQRTVFISYKHCNFEKDDGGRRPPWGVKKLAEAFMSRGFGVWLDALCAPRGAKPSRDELGRKDVRRLLAEGHAQSAVIIGLDTQDFLKPGRGGHNWTRGEYTGTLSRRGRSPSLSRFVLHEGVETKVRPAPDDHLNWSKDLRSRIVPAVARLL